MIFLFGVIETCTATHMSSNSAARLPSKVESGMNKVGRGAKSAVDGAVAMTGKAIGFLEGPVAAAAMIIVAFLGLWALYKMFRSWECRPGKGTTAYTAGRTIARHSARLKSGKGDKASLSKAVDAESDDGKHHDVRCTVAMAGLRAVSGTLTGSPVLLTTANDDGMSPSTQISNSLRDVRVWCQHGQLQDGKLNACDAIKAWKAECELKSVTQGGAGAAAGPTLNAGAQFLVDAASANDKKKGALALERMITGDPVEITRSDVDRIKKVANDVDKTTLMATVTKEGCDGPLVDKDNKKAGKC
jgi:hypothetical protein